MIGLVSCIAILLLQGGTYSLASPSGSRISSSSSSKLPINDDSLEEWHRHWSSQNVCNDPSELEDHLITLSLQSDSTLPTESSMMPESDYKVDLSTDRYWQKYQDALSNDNAAKAEKNEAKHSLLVDKDTDGMYRLAAQYRQEYESLRDEKTIHHYKAEWAKSTSNHWRNLACALAKTRRESLGVDASTSASIEKRERDRIYQEAQWEASALVKSTSPLTDFNLQLSEGRMKGAKARYHSRRDARTKKKMDKAIKLHDHRINALLHRSTDDANALALYYDDKMIKHEKACEEKEEKAEKVAIRRSAWRNKAEEIESRLSDEPYKM